MSEKKAKTGLFKGIKKEFKKIVWPTKSELLNSTIVVIVSLIAVSVVVKLIDIGLKSLLKLIV
ncbi:MAG: preprotein translocase subunit SecE [Tissierellia bacterium]|nr:preprotein translocase subunit SecE [Tissierellia bacterium]